MLTRRVRIASYRFSAPKVVFITRLYHPNVSDSGAICVDLLKNHWSPALSLFKVMLSLSSLLTDPNPSASLVAQLSFIVF
jgi:ubiquitin-protein ligase